MSRPIGPMLRWPRLAVTGEMVVVALSSLSLFAAVVGAGQIIVPSMPVTPTAPPAPPSMAVRALAPQQALAVNASIPLTAGPNPAAAAFDFKGNAAARDQATTCLANAVYYEAGNQDGDGGRAVAQVVLNRVRHPAFPASVCGVVYQGSTRATGCQFTFTCDGSLYRRPNPVDWGRARAIAAAAIAGAVYAPVGWATHYHANYVVPYWAASLAKNAVVGAHLFYHWGGNWGGAGAFSQSYSGRELSAEGLRTSALAAEAATAAAAGPALDRAIAAIPGAEAIKLAPSMRGDKRVAIRFNMAARKAADEAEHKVYTDNFRSSDNLKWTLSAETTDSAAVPFGKPAGAASRERAIPSGSAAPGQ